jgi:hypothetical protein
LNGAESVLVNDDKKSIVIEMNEMNEAEENVTRKNVSGEEKKVETHKNEDVVPSTPETNRNKCHRWLVVLIAAAVLVALMLLVALICGLVFGLQSVDDCHHHHFHAINVDSELN